MVRITPIYKPWSSENGVSSAIWKGSDNPIIRGRKLTMVINHLLAAWDPPSGGETSH